MRTRIIITIFLLTLSVLLLNLAFHSNPNITKEDIYLNLSSELIGIILTTIFVDWLFEKKQIKEDIKKISWNGINKIKYSTWVWLGTPRDLDATTLVKYLDIVSDKDVIAISTQNLLLQLANTSEETIALSPKAVNSNKQLKRALNKLVEMSNLRDTRKRISPKDIANLLIDITKDFSGALDLGKSTNNRDLLLTDIDSKIESQNWRFYGHE